MRNDTNGIAAQCAEAAAQSAEALVARNRERFLEISEALATGNEVAGLIEEWNRLAEALDLFAAAEVRATALGGEATAYGVLVDDFITPFRRLKELRAELDAAESARSSGPVLGGLRDSVSRLEQRLEEVSAPIKRDLSIAKQAVAQAEMQNAHVAQLQNHLRNAESSTKLLPVLLKNQAAFQAGVRAKQRHKEAQAHAYFGRGLARFKG